jgi:hypothetical protein
MDLLNFFNKYLIIGLGRENADVDRETVGRMAV